MANQPNKGFKRIYNALGYSLAGFKATFENEEAFRQELILVALTLPVAFIIFDSPWQWALIWFCAMMILLVEILNSAIESIVDRVGSERHELSGRAKDMGSAAVSVILLTYAGLWFILLFDRFAY